MTTISKENRAALQSVRAKARKALAVNDANLPANIAKHLEAVVAYVDGALKPAKVTKIAKAAKPKSKGKGKAPVTAKNRKASAKRDAEVAAIAA